jgi:glycosyltransferase involved in cell wall biosynthesis
MSRPRVLFVSRERLQLPLDATQRRKWDAVASGLDLYILAAARAGSPLRDGNVRLWPLLPALDGPLYYAALPMRVAAALRTFRPDAMFVQGVHEAAEVLAVRSLVRSRARLILDVEGDWHAVTRLYGSRARRLLDPLSDAIGAGVVPRADGIRTLSGFTSSVVRAAGGQPTAEFPPFVDTVVFLEPPVAPFPSRPVVLFVGVLERYKGFDTLARAWPRVAGGADLHVVGRGTLAPLARELVARGARWTPSLDAAGVRAAMDSATLLCLPSRAEGLGRVVIESMCRGRAVVGGRAGGIPDLVEEGADGLLADPDDPEELAAALVRAVADAERLGAAARASGERLAVPPAEYGARIERLVRSVLEG